MLACKSCLFVHVSIHVLSSSFWNHVIVIPFFVGEAIDRPSTCHIFAFASVVTRTIGVGISEVVVAHVVLRESVAYPALVFLILITIFVSRVVVHARVIMVLWPGRHRDLVSRGRLLALLVSTVIEITFPSELRGGDIIIIVVITFDSQLSFLFGLFYPLLSVDGRESYVCSPVIECELRNAPFTSLVVPFGPLMQFLELVFAQQNTHDLVAELDSLFLTPYYI